MIHYIYQALDNLLSPICEGVEWYAQQDGFGEPIILKDKKIYVEFQPITYKSLHYNRQEAALTIVLHVGFSSRSDMRDRSAVLLRQAELLSEIYNRLHGVSIQVSIDGITHSITGRLDRLSERYAHRVGPVEDHTVSFSTRIIDDRAVRRVTLVEPIVVEPSVSLKS